MNKVLYLLILIFSIWITAKVSYWIGWTRREVMTYDEPYVKKIQQSQVEYYNKYMLKNCLIKVKQMEGLQ